MTSLSSSELFRSPALIINFHNCNKPILYWIKTLSSFTATALERHPITNGYNVCLTHVNQLLRKYILTAAT